MSSNDRKESFPGAGTTGPGAARLQYRTDSSMSRVIRLVFLTVLGLWIIFPVAWVILLSLKTDPDAYTNAILPSQGLTLEAYTSTWSAIDTLPRNVLNSLIVAFGTVILTTTAAVLAGFALVHLKTPGRGVVLAVIVASLFVQVRVTGLIGIFEIQRQLGLIDRAWGLIFPYTTLSLAIGILVMRAVFQRIPREFAEAAEVDGAGPWWIFFHVMLPLAQSGVVVVALTAFILSWGEYLMAATFITPSDEKTVPLLLATATGGMGQWSWPAIASVFVAVLIPVICLIFSCVR